MCTKVTSAIIPVWLIVKDKLKVSHPIDILKRPKVTSGSMLTKVCSLAFDSMAAENCRSLQVTASQLRFT